MKKGLSSWDRLDRKRPALTIVKARQDRVNNTAVNNDTGNHLNCEESWEAFNIICNATVHNCFPNSVYSRAWPSGISAMWKKKCLIKFTLPGQIGRKKKDSSIKYYFFEKKYSKTLLTTTLIWLPLYDLLWTFIASYTGRKNGFTERQRWSQTRDKGHLCTPLFTFDARQMFTFARGQRRVFRR